MNPLIISTISCGSTQIVNGIEIYCVSGVTGVSATVEANARTGSETTLIYEGMYSAIKNQQAWLYTKNVYQMRLFRVDNGTLYRLQATLPYDENGQEPIPLTGIYDLDIEMLEPSVFSSPVLRSMLPDNLIALVARICSNFQAGNYSMTTSSGDVTTTDGGWAAAIADIKSGITDPDYQARAIQLFATVCALKTEAFISYYSVFKRTLTAADPTQVEISRTGEGEIWTTAEVAAFENINESGWFQLTANAQWLKSRVNITSCAGQKTQVTYSYTEFQQANGLLYVPYSSAVLLYGSTTDLPPSS